MSTTRPGASALFPNATPGPFVDETSTAGLVLVWFVGTTTALLLAGLATIRIVGRHQFLVVFRLGRVAAVKRFGFVFVVPGLHRTVRVPRTPVRVDLWWVEAVSADGVAVSVSGSLLTEVRDPVRYATHPTPGETATGKTAEALVREYVGARSLAELVRPGAIALRELATAIGSAASQWGMDVTDLELSRMDITLHEELLRWADSVARRRVQKTAFLGTVQKPNGGGSIVDITRTTVPGTGTLHHCLTRTGQRLAVLVDNAETRQLLVYGSADLDVPAQTIVLEQDEADQVADILHSRSVADRLATLERRFAEVTGDAR